MSISQAMWTHGHFVLGNHFPDSNSPINCHLKQAMATLANSPLLHTTTVETLGCRATSNFFYPPQDKPTTAIFEVFTFPKKGTLFIFITGNSPINVLKTFRF